MAGGRMVCGRETVRVGDGHTCPVLSRMDTAGCRSAASWMPQRRTVRFSV